MDIEAITALIENHAAVAIFLILVVSAMGIPIPEEPILVASGLAVGWLSVEIVPALLACFFGVIAGDVFVYGAGRYCAGSILKIPPFRWLFTPGNQEKIGRLYARHGGKAIVMARFLAPFRFGVFVFAGQHRMKFRSFVAIDSISALFYVPIVVLTGVFIASLVPDRQAALARASDLIQDGRAWLFIGGVLIVTVFVCTSLKNRSAPARS